MESSIKELSKYRYESSLEDLEDARLMFENKRYKNTLNRAYYSILHGMRAVNAIEGFDSSKHSGVIAFFNQHFVKTEIFPKDLSKVIRLASENREKADYLDFFIASRDEAKKQMERAEYFSGFICNYLKEHGVIVEK